MVIRFLLAACLLVPLSVVAQPSSALLHETRGTWLTTVWRLDWPPVGSAAYQEQRLREIIRNAKSLGLNTVVFQVLSHGEAMYPSERLPWANWLTGTPGQDPGYDPMAVAIDEAHQIGLEVHAWINVFHVAASTSNISPTAEPVHVRFAHPDWIVQVADGSFWGNPGLPGFRDWQVGNVMELVNNYDLDAIHFDYMRYPGPTGLPGDAEIRSLHPNAGNSLAQWRRENINIFVRDIYQAVREAKPWVKVGAAPIGAYRWFNGAPPGYWAWNDLYQEAHTWLSEGVIDYVAPQLYFTIGNAPIPPNSYQSQDFTYWLTDWLENSSGRHVYAGHGTWLETAENRFPSGEIAQQIATTRLAGAQGQVHFRYTHTTGAPFDGQYLRPSLPPPMAWIESAAAPSIPSELAIAHEAGSNAIRISWSPSVAAADDPLRRYAIFRREGALPEVIDADDLFAVVGSVDTSFVEVFSEPPSIPVHYAVVAQSSLGMTSGRSNVVSTAETGVSKEVPGPLAALRLWPPFPNPSREIVTVRYETAVAEEVSLFVYDLLGRRISVLADGLHPQGVHTAEFDLTPVSSGSYLIVLRTREARLVRRLTIAP
jgi:uncharacterized lipoprotein YddW (UPF0748 family)